MINVIQSPFAGFESRNVFGEVVGQRDLLALEGEGARNPGRIKVKSREQRECQRRLD